MASWGFLLKSAGSLATKAVEGIKAALPHIKTAAKEASKTVVNGVKAATPHVKNVVKEGAHAVKGTAEFVGKHPVVSAVGLGVALPHLGYKEGLLNFGLGVLGGQKAKDNGLVNYGSDILLGNGKDEYGNDKSIVAKTGEALIGKEGYADLKESVGNGYDHLKQGATTAYNAVGNLYQDGRQMVGGMFQGNGMVSNDQGYYYDPTAPAYPTMNQMTGQQGSGLMGGLMNGMNSAVNAISGGNVSKMNIAGLLLSAYMMFGRFGWLGKAASLMLGGMTLNNINNRQQPMRQQQQGYQQPQGMGQSVQAAPHQVPPSTQMPTEQDDDVIYRSRSM